VLAPLLFVCAAGCADVPGRDGRNPSSPDAAEKAAAADGAADCVIEGPGASMTGDYLLFALPDLSAPIARVVRADQVRARITLLSDREVAAVTLLSPKLELYGFVARGELHFVTRERVSLSGSELFLERARPVTVRAVNGSRVTADVPSPFQKAPASIQISCENLAYQDGTAGPIRSPTVSWAAQRSSGPIAFFDEPRGSLVLRAETDEPMRVLEVRDGFTHVSIGDAQPWCWQGIVADAWVASGDIAPRDEPADIDDACFAILDSTDRCPVAGIAKRTELWLGDPKQESGDLTHIGWLKQGAELLSSGKPRNHFAEIRLDDEAIAAPPGLSFFVDRGAIANDYVPSAADDGCPSADR
jgi:hypothetical protein